MEPLSNYEILYAFYETGHLINGSLATAMSVMGGFMVAGVFVGQVLDRMMTALFVSVYMLFFSILSLTLVRQTHAYGELMEEIRVRNANGVDFSWHGGVNMPDFVIAAGVWPLVLILSLAFIGSLLFFFRTRTVDPKQFR